MKKQVSILMIALLAVFASCSNDDDDKTVYTVTFETDGGSPVPPVQRVEEGSMANAPSTNPAKAGYAFVFWHLSGATTAYNFQSPVKGDMTLYAKWQEEATAEYWQVTWNLNGGTWPSDDNHAMRVLKEGTLAEPNAPTKTGSTFDGWYKESALTNKVAFPYDVSNLTADFTLYAKWTGEEPVVEPDIAFVAGEVIASERLYEHGFFKGTRVYFSLIVYDAAGRTSITIEEVAKGAPNTSVKQITHKREISISGAGTYRLSQILWSEGNYPDISGEFTYTVSAHGKSYTTKYAGTYFSYGGGIWDHRFGIREGY